MFYINSGLVLSISSTVANFGSLNIGTLGKISIGAASATENLYVQGSTNVTCKIICTSGDAAIYLVSGTKISGWICNNSSGVKFVASTTTTPYILKFQVSSAIINLTMNVDGSSSFGTYPISSGAIVSSGNISTSSGGITATGQTINIGSVIATSIISSGNLKVYDHNYTTFTSGVISHPFGLQFAITSAKPPSVGTVLLSMDVASGVGIQSSLNVTGNLTVGGVCDCPILNVTGASKLALQPEMTYTTESMLPSSSSQVGYIAVSKSFVTTPLTTTLSSYICSFQLVPGIYQFNCSVTIQANAAVISVNAGLYIDNIEIYSPTGVTRSLLNSLNFSFAYTNFNTNNFGD